METNQALCEREKKFFSLFLRESKVNWRGVAKKRFFCRSSFTWIPRLVSNRGRKRVFSPSSPLAYGRPTLHFKNNNRYVLVCDRQPNPPPLPFQFKVKCVFFLTRFNLRCCYVKEAGENPHINFTLSHPPFFPPALFFPRKKEEKILQLLFPEGGIKY